MKIIIYILLILSIITSCSKNKTYTIVISDGVKKYLNKNIPNNKDLNIIVKELFRIKGCSDKVLLSDGLFTDPTALDIDSKGNIYVLDTKSSSIKKFDKNGEFINSFGKQGSGPGEMRYPVSIFCQNDTISVLNQSVKQIVKFDALGNFIENQSTKKCKMPVYLTGVGNNKLVTLLCNWRKEKDGKYMDYDLALITNEYNIIKYFVKQSIPEKDVYYADYDHPFSISSNEIFISKYSKSNYSIDVYDHNGNKKYSIIKTYRKVKLTDEELYELHGENMPSNMYKFKNSINKIFSDNNGYLWVAISIDRNEKNKKDFVIDVFKNGIYQNRVTLDIVGSSEDRYNRTLYLKDNRLYCLNSEDVEIIVYDFRYK